MYSIEKILNDLGATDETDDSKNQGNKTESDDKIIVLACKPKIVQNSQASLFETPSVMSVVDNGFYNDYITGYKTLSVVNPKLKFDSNNDITHSPQDAVMYYEAPASGIYELEIDIDCIFPNLIKPIFVLGEREEVPFEGRIYTEIWNATTGQFTVYAKLRFNLDEGYKLPIKLYYTKFTGDITVDTFDVYIENVSTRYWNLVKEEGSIISGFKGDYATAYNVPLTPKRIINQHLSYIGISNYKNTLPIIFTSTSLDADMISKMSWESANVIEKGDIITDDESIVFKPITITFDTAIDYDTLTSIKEDKYKYFEIIEKGVTYTGWIDVVAFNIGKNQKQQWKLQAHDIL